MNCFVVPSVIVIPHPLPHGRTLSPSLPPFYPSSSPRTDGGAEAIPVHTSTNMLCLFSVIHPSLSIGDTEVGASESGIRKGANRSSNNQTTQKKMSI